MTPLQIEELFKETVNKRDFTKRTGFDKNKVYNYRHRALPSVGTQLEILLSLDLISIKKV